MLRQRRSILLLAATLGLVALALFLPIVLNSGGNAPICVLPKANAQDNPCLAQEATIGALKGALLQSTLDTLNFQATIKALQNPAASGPAVVNGPIIYQVTWQNGLEGWKTTNGWQRANGAFYNNGSSRDTGNWKDNWTAAPIPIDLPNFAVEMEAQIIKQPSCGSFGIMIRESYEAGVHICDQPKLVVRVRQGDELGGTDLKADNEWHVYRVEVRGAEVKVLLDGNEVVLVAAKASSPTNVVGLWSDRMQVNVRVFRIISL